MLAHGLGYSGQDWRDSGYVDLLRHAYQLILVDHRGHGRSGKPHDPDAYGPESRVMDHVAVLDHAGISKAHFWGYSLGGAVGYQIGMLAPDRFHSLIIGGEDPYPPSDGPSDTPSAGDPVLELFAQGGEAWMAHREASMPLTPAMKARYRENDFQALRSVRLAPKRWRREILAHLPSFQLPCLLYVGEAEDSYPAMRKAATEIRDATLVTLPEQDHVDIWRRTADVVPHVLRFLDRFD
jgi:pimeloyl-ACP methyl ester carboxylesterase